MPMDIKCQKHSYEKKCIMLIIYRKLEKLKILIKKDLSIEFMK